MLNERRGNPELSDGLGLIDSKLIARLRLFGLLTLLVPLFAGLQLIVHEGIPRVEVRLVAQDVPTTVPVEVPVERVVERVVYVPVERVDTAPQTGSIEPGRDRVSGSPVRRSEPSAEIAAAPPTRLDDAAPDPEAPAAMSASEPAPDTPPLTGIVALAQPAAPEPPALAAAAPQVVAPRAVAPVTVRPAAAVAPAPAVQVTIADESEEEVAVAEADDADAEVAAADEAGAEPVVAEAEPGEPEETILVRQFVSEVPVVHDDRVASVGMLRHELFTRESKPAPIVVEEVADDAAPEAGEDGSEPAFADDEAAPESDVEVFAAPEAEEPAADTDEPVSFDEPVSEQKAISSEELLSQAKSVRVEMIDHGSSGEQALGVLEHQLVARPPNPEPIAEAEEEQPADTALEEDSVEADDIASADEIGEVAESADDEPVNEDPQ
jgi:hypothetical protein